jgi:MULE transposase domain
MNRYNIPLLYFIGVMLLSDSFSIAFYFIAAENEVQYTIAIALFIRAIHGSEVKVKVILTNNKSELKKALSR